MKATLTFNLPEERSEYHLCNNADKLATIIYEFTQLVRTKTKYATGDEKDPSWEDIRTAWWHLLEEANYDPYAEEQRMIKLLKDGKTLRFTGKDYTLVMKYAKKHKLTFRDVVYLALINGLAKKEGIK